MSEEWKQSRMDAGYEVSSEGRVRSKDRMVPQKACGRAAGYERLLPGRLLKPFISKSTGYLQVNFSGKARHSVHRLVALEFCEGHEDGRVVNHKSGDRADNRAANLEWVTPQENNLHAFRELGRAPTSLGKFSGEHPTSKAVIATDLLTGEQFYYESAMDAVREGFDSGAISNCCSGRLKKHKGRSWRKPEQWEAAA
ncbi:MAG TPA: endonuclease [Pseudomonas sp.]|nr:endonuclease [Pseudomonas sp.]|tara:strand:- start:35 stop:625 length:591 start_codon:yes stop_codon:yes gene_type:complete